MEMAKTKIRFDLPIQLGYHILQLAKLRMLQFRYDCLQEYCDVNDFEYIEMDTDSAYLSLAGKQLEDIVKPSKKQVLHYDKMGQCHDFDYSSEDGFFPRECCQKHKAYDKRTPGLFKVEAQGKAMIGLCSKTYILKKTWRQSEIQFQRTQQSGTERTLPLLPTRAPDGTDQILDQPRIQDPRQHHLHLPTNQRRTLLLLLQAGSPSRRRSYQTSIHYSHPLASSRGGSGGPKSSLEPGKGAWVVHQREDVWSDLGWCMPRETKCTRKCHPPTTSPHAQGESDCAPHTFPKEEAH